VDFYTANTKLDRLKAAFAKYYLPAFKVAGIENYTLWVSEMGKNDFPRLPVFQDGNLLVVTGKTFGITNIIALDAEHNIIQDQRVMVERDDRRVVNLHKGSTRFTYTCTPNCEPTLTIGDDKSFFDSVRDANTNKMKFSEGASDGAAATSNGQ